MLDRQNVRTESRCALIDITDRVRRVVERSGVRSGLCVVFVPHTTAVTINENADPSVTSDIQRHLADMVPERSDFRHGEGNSDAHIKSSLFGPSLTVIVDGGELVLGTWQGIYFAEWDGPRSRTLFVKTIGDEGAGD